MAMIEKLAETSGRIIGFVLSGRLHHQDYKIFVPQVEEAIKRAGKVRLLACFRDFHGWDLHAGWDDMRFAVRHYDDLERIALVGDRKWEEWMAKICQPFTGAQVQYFDSADIKAAWEWLREES